MCSCDCSVSCDYSVQWKLCNLTHQHIRMRLKLQQHLQAKISLTSQALSGKFISPSVFQSLYFFKG